MTLAEYLQATKESDAEFGARAKVGRAKIWAYRLRKASPSLKNAALIVAATGERVGYADLDAKAKPSRRKHASKRSRAA